MTKLEDSNKELIKSNKELKNISNKDIDIDEINKEIKLKTNSKLTMEYASINVINENIDIKNIKVKRIKGRKPIIRNIICRNER